MIINTPYFTIGMIALGLLIFGIAIVLGSIILNNLYKEDGHDSVYKFVPINFFINKKAGSMHCGTLEEALLGYGRGASDVRYEQFSKGTRYCLKLPVVTIKDNVAATNMKDPSTILNIPISEGCVVEMLRQGNLTSLTHSDFKILRNIVFADSMMRVVPSGKAKYIGPLDLCSSSWWIRGNADDYFYVIESGYIADMYVDKGALVLLRNTIDGTRPKTTNDFIVVLSNKEFLGFF